MNFFCSPYVMLRTSRLSRSRISCIRRTESKSFSCTRTTDHLPGSTNPTGIAEAAVGFSVGSIPYAAIVKEAGDPHRSMVRIDPNAVDWASRMHRFETKTGMTPVLFEESIGPTSLLLNLRRQVGKGPRYCAVAREITASLGRAPQSGQHGVLPMLRQRVGQADHGN